MRKNITLIVLTVLLCSFSIIEKSYFAELVDKKLEEYSTVYAPEKIYIHTDKSFYSLDETIWFSSYLVNGITHEKSDKSWVIYVELFDGKDSLVSKRKLFTNNISAAGDFKIEKNWKPGNYILQAYTKHMENSSPDYFFKKEIKVFDPTTTDSLKLTTSKSKSDVVNQGFKQVKPDLKFYPEGGDLVVNLRSKVAIKIQDIGLNGIELSGAIVNDKGEKISGFKTAEFGLSIFTIQPKPNTSYFAELNVNGVEYSYKLPTPLPKGHNLSVLNKGESLVVNVSSSVETGLANTYLVAHQRGKQVFNKYQKNAEQYTLKIPTKAFKDGVLHLTLFNNTGKPVCERLVFITNKNNEGTVDILKEKEVLGKRKEQTITLNTKNNENGLLPSYLSVSVRDLNAFPYNRYNKNIKTYLLLNSDLRGHIPQAGYFFDGEMTMKKLYILDLLMLTNGWRRFTWQDLLYQKSKNTFNAEKGIYISGKTRHLKNPYGPVAAETRITFFGDKGIVQEPVQKSKSTGEFKFGPFIFYDSIQTLVESRLTNFKSKNDKDRNVLILVNEDKHVSRLDRKDIFTIEKSGNSQIENYLKAASYVKKLKDELEQKRQILEEITIIAENKRELDKRNEALNKRTDYGYPSNRIDFETDFIETGQTVFDILNTIPGVSAYNDSISIRGGGGTPLILLDQFPIDIDVLRSLQTIEIAFVDVLKGPDAAFYPRGSNGVIAVYSKTGNISTTRNVKRKPGIIDFVAQGFYTAKEFYSPDYAHELDIEGTTDVRTTLYWNPKVIIDTEVGKKVSFFTSDTKGDYLIEIEGISVTGIPLHATTIFSVE
ncbi:Plug domain-containing protein [Flavobacteriaceae bacterium MHTCC 0001]